MKRTWNALLAIGVMALAAVSARAESAVRTVPDPLTLSAARDALAESNRPIRLARRALEAAEADLQRAAVRPNPTLTGQISNTVPGRYGVPESDRLLRLEQTFERGGKRDLRIGVATAYRAAARHDLAEVTRQQRVQLAGAYFDQVAAQRLTEIADDNALAYARLVDAAQRRLRAGDLAPLDLSRLRVEASRAENDARAAKAALTQARIVLAGVLGVEHLAATLKAADDFPDLAQDPLTGRSIEARRDSALALRADAAAASARLEASNRTRILAASQRARDVTLGVQAERSPAFGGNVFGLSAAIPLLIGNDYSGDIARAEADAAQAAEELERVRATIRADIDRNSEQLAAARDRARKLIDIAMPEAKRAVDAVEYAFQRGAATLTDLFDGRRQYAAVRAETIAAQADYAKALVAFEESLTTEELP